MKTLFMALTMIVSLACFAAPGDQWFAAYGQVEFYDCENPPEVAVGPSCSVRPGAVFPDKSVFIEIGRTPNYIYAQNESGQGYLKRSALEPFKPFLGNLFIQNIAENIFIHEQGEKIFLTIDLEPIAGNWCYSIRPEVLAQLPRGSDKKQSIIDFIAAKGGMDELTDDERLLCGNLPIPESSQLNDR